MRVGYLSPGASIAIGSSGQVCTKLDIETEREGYEGLQSARSDTGQVDGTLPRIPFPVDGPDCKYNVLFDTRPAFDTLREAFMVHADPDAQANLFLRLLREQGLGATSVDFAEKVLQWIGIASPVLAPVNFDARLECLLEVRS